MSVGEKDLAVQLLDLRIRMSFENGVDMQRRIIQVVGIIDEHMFRLVDCAMNFLEDGSRKAITLRINSEGGHPSAALAIIGRIKSSTCHVICEGYGIVESAATVILASGKKRRMSEYCQFMTHQSAYVIEGNHTQVQDYVAQAERDEQLWATYMAKFSNMDAAYWYNLHKTGKDKFFNAQECLKLGIVDELF